MSDVLLENLVQDLIECVEFKYDVYRKMKAAGYHKHQLRQVVMVREDWFETVMAVFEYLGMERVGVQDRIWTWCGECGQGWLKPMENRELVRCGECQVESLRLVRE